MRWRAEKQYFQASHAATKSKEMPKMTPSAMPIFVPGFSNVFFSAAGVVGFGAWSRALVDVRTAVVSVGLRLVDADDVIVAIVDVSVCSKPSIPMIV
jgi:hypothetical protein